MYIFCQLVFLKINIYNEYL